MIRNTCKLPEPHTVLFRGDHHPAGRFQAVPGPVNLPYVLFNKKMMIGKIQMYDLREHTFRKSDK